MGKRDSILIKTDNFVCALNNTFVYIKDILRKDSYDYKKNKELIAKENMNDVCFVIGNGPSLRDVDFNLIKDYPSITVNGFYKTNVTFTSKYHLLVDPDYNNSIWHDYIYELLNKNPNVVLIISRSIKEAIRSIKGNLNNVFIIKDSYKQVGNNIQYDLTKEITGSINVVPVAIECALYMGYKRICLLGCDFSMYTQVKGIHFYDDDKTFENEGDINNINENNVGNLIRCALVHKQHYAISNIAKEKKCIILNATNGSLIDAYPFITLKDFLSGIQ